MAGGPKIGLALGAGGARGIAHVGVLDVLQREGLVPACIAGTSMGSIIGGLWAECGDADEVERRLALYIDDPGFRASWEPFLPDEELEEEPGFLGGLRRAVQRKVVTFRTFTTPAQQSADRLLDPLGRMFHRERIEDLDVPFAAVSVDLESGELRVGRTGDLVRAIYASSAIPGVFPPLEEPDGARLVDGGGPSRVPVDVCRTLGPDLVLAIDIPSFAPEKPEYDTGLEAILRYDAITRKRLAELMLARADLVVTPDVDDFHWASFGAADRIRAAGETAMEAALPELRRRMRAWKGPAARARRAMGRWLGR